MRVHAIRCLGAGILSAAIVCCLPAWPASAAEADPAGDTRVEDRKKAWQSEAGGTGGKAAKWQNTLRRAEEKWKKKSAKWRKKGKGFRIF